MRRRDVQGISAQRPLSPSLRTCAPRASTPSAALRRARTAVLDSSAIRPGFQQHLVVVHVMLVDMATCRA